MDHRAELLAAFDATEADLAVNRRGELTDRQRQLVRRAVDEDATSMFVIALVLAVVMYGIGGFLVVDGRVFRVEDGSDVAGVIGIAFGTFVLPTAGIVWAGYTAWIASKARGKLTVKVYEGAVETRSIAYKQSEVFDLRVAGKTFQLTPRAFAVIVSGAHYRVHMIDEIAAVIAVEPLEGP
ncbi:MAG: hypothetical protein J0L92_02895 [Deltaproteobacteria bacterium]|nr:hypothetical protein [Deltaproteobacteria bacterium]